MQYTVVWKEFAELEPDSDFLGIEIADVQCEETDNAAPDQMMSEERVALIETHDSGYPFFDFVGMVETPQGGITHQDMAKLYEKWEQLSDKEERPAYKTFPDYLVGKHGCKQLDGFHVAIVGH